MNFHIRNYKHSFIIIAPKQTMLVTKLAKSLQRSFLTSSSFYKAFSTTQVNFNPTDHGLNPDFLLTNFSDLKGCGCKVPQAKLLEYIKDIGDGKVGVDTPDCSTIPIPGTNSVLVSTTDFFYPLVDDPYNQGRIACCNVLSDLYCMGITRVDTILMILGVSLKMSEKERDISNNLMIKGFNDAAEAAGTAITGGQTVYNPWVMIGGTAMSVLREEEIIRPNKLKAGEVLILTKPLGAQLVVNFNQWMKLKNDKWKKLEEHVSEQTILDAYEKGVKYMSTLNLSAAQLMQKYKSSGATDVTGFGIKGHSQNLANAQNEAVDLVINKLPVIEGLHKYDKIARDFRFKEGRAAETSGGILLGLAKERAQDFLAEYREITGFAAHIVGEVVKGERKSIILDDVECIAV